MTRSASSPIKRNWSSTFDEEVAAPASGLPATASAVDLNEELALWSVAELIDFQPELVVAVRSLAASGGRPWSIGDDEPTVVLLRLSARMGLLQPDMSTTAAAQVLELLRLSRLG